MKQQKIVLKSIAFLLATMLGVSAFIYTDVVTNSVIIARADTISLEEFEAPAEIPAQEVIEVAESEPEVTVEPEIKEPEVTPSSESTPEISDEQDIEPETKSEEITESDPEDLAEDDISETGENTPETTPEEINTEDQKNLPTEIEQQETEPGEIIEEQTEPAVENADEEDENIQFLDSLIEESEENYKTLYDASMIYIGELELQIEALEKLLAENQSNAVTVNELQNKVGSMTSQIASLQNSLNNANANINNLKAQRTAISSTPSYTYSAPVSNPAPANNTSQEVNALTKDIVSLKEQLASMKKDTPQIKEEPKTPAPEVSTVSVEVNEPMVVNKDIFSEPREEEKNAAVVSDVTVNLAKEPEEDIVEPTESIDTLSSDSFFAKPEENEEIAMLGLSETLTEVEVDKTNAITDEAFYNLIANAQNKPSTVSTMLNLGSSKNKTMNMALLITAISVMASIMIYLYGIRTGIFTNKFLAFLVKDKKLAAIDNEIINEKKKIQ